jgi:proteasome lid subunit RPN8/RPN11
MTNLISDNKEVLGLIVTLAASVTASILIHWVVFCCRLYRHYTRFPTGLLFWRVFAELRRYRDLARMGGKPLTFYYFGYVMAWFNLLLAITTVVVILWFQSHPDGF